MSASNPPLGESVLPLTRIPGRPFADLLAGRLKGEKRDQPANLPAICDNPSIGDTPS